MSPFPTSRGHLNPGGISMTRLPAGDAVAELVRHYWIPEWDLPAGRIERQLVLGYPVCNLVVERDVVTLAGPTTRVSHRDLTGRGWAVGSLLRPAAGPGVLDTGMFGPPLGVAATADRELHARTDDAARLRSLVTDAFARSDVAAAVAAVEAFLLTVRPRITEDGLLANQLQDLVESSPVRHVDELSAALAVSTRSLQRICRRYLGITPSAMIRRRRLQDAADMVRRNPDADLTTVAIAHGYADHAHLTREFREVLGFTPSQYRAQPGG